MLADGNFDSKWNPIINASHELIGAKIENLQPYFTDQTS